MFELAIFKFLKNIVKILTKQRVRKQQVFIGKSSSSWSDVDSGVPQGSVLGPLLYIFYINDLPGNLTHKFKIYADDGKLIVELEADRDDDDIQPDINK